MKMQRKKIDKQRHEVIILGIENFKRLEINYS